MKEVKTGIYKRIIIRLPEKELTIPVKNLESKIKELNILIKERSQDLEKRGKRENIERLKKICKTGNLLMRG
ncbi:hypothetical protein GW931_01385 [archaeon]|nr:hypothetical protein [archaeon]PJC45621.1 MAG: hypothetical protein CO037_00570 [Candidatus Pacearchaeota archaeon CG_4_9_14_0_2_um_filter_30_8]